MDSCNIKRKCKNYNLKIVLSRRCDDYISFFSSLFVHCITSKADHDVTSFPSAPGGNKTQGSPILKSGVLAPYSATCIR